jgi:antirestriction protein ArdC
MSMGNNGENQMAYDLYKQVTARILSELEKGVLPWVKPWSATPGANTPCNAITNRPYSGTNVILLWIADARGWPTPRFLTFKQAKDAGGTVRGGEHGTKIVFMKRSAVKDKRPDAKEDDMRQVALLKEYTVFNVAQCDGLSERIISGPTVVRMRNPDTRDELADAFVATTGAIVREGHGQAMYIPSLDVIGMPKFEDFKGADDFYNTLLHELTHWTSHKDRCERKLQGRFGDKAYAAEELVAQLGAAFMCAEFAFDGECQDASYIATWIKLLKDDDKAFFTAASAAQKAVDFLRGKALEEPLAQAA